MAATTTRRRINDKTHCPELTTTNKQQLKLSGADIAELTDFVTTFCSANIQRLKSFELSKTQVVKLDPTLFLHALHHLTELTLSQNFLLSSLPCAQCNEATSQTQCASTFSGCDWCSVDSSCVVTGDTCTQCSEATDQTQCSSSFSGCDWCSVDASCVVTGDTCTQCSEATDQTQCTTKFSGCDWCSVDSSCAVTGDICTQCSEATDQTQCTTTFSGCDWCSVDSSCALIGDTCAQCSEATYRIQQCTTTFSGCEWCPADSSCVATGDSCTQCYNAASELECTSTFSGCDWCSIDSSCVASGNPCTQCGEATNELECTNTFSGCDWCFVDSSCVATGDTCTQCGEATNELECTNTFFGCDWCFVDSSCVATGDTSQCSEATDQLQCTATFSGCDWCSVDSSCIATGDTCTQCSEATDQTQCTTTFSGCDWCAAQATPVCGYSGTCAICTSITEESDCDDAFACEWCQFIHLCSVIGECGTVPISTSAKSNCDTCVVDVTFNITRNLSDSECAQLLEEIINYLGVEEDQLEIQCTTSEDGTTQVYITILPIENRDGDDDTPTDIATELENDIVNSTLGGNLTRYIDPNTVIVVIERTSSTPAFITSHHSPTSTALYISLAAVSFVAVVVIGLALVAFFVCRRNNATASEKYELHDLHSGQQISLDYVNTEIFSEPVECDAPQFIPYEEPTYPTSVNPAYIP